MTHRGPFQPPPFCDSVICLPGKYSITEVIGGSNLDWYSISGRKLLLQHWDVTCSLLLFICIIESSDLGDVQNSFSF